MCWQSAGVIWKVQRRLKFGPLNTDVSGTRCEKIALNTIFFISSLSLIQLGNLFWYLKNFFFKTGNAFWSLKYTFARKFSSADIFFLKLCIISYKIKHVYICPPDPWGWPPLATRLKCDFMFLITKNIFLSAYFSTLTLCYVVTFYLFDNV